MTITILAIVDMLTIALVLWIAYQNKTKHNKRKSQAEKYEILQVRAGDKLSVLTRRRKALAVANKNWLMDIEHGWLALEAKSRKAVEVLEREVAELENELFEPKKEESATPKPEAPKRKHVTNVSGRYHEVWGRIYRVKCSACAWSWDSYSAKTAEAEGTAHERRNA